MPRENVTQPQDVRAVSPSPGSAATAGSAAATDVDGDALARASLDHKPEPEVPYFEDDFSWALEALDESLAARKALRDAESSEPSAPRPVDPETP